MKILITSDTHGYYDRISDLILDQGDFDLMIHAGDGVEDCKNINYETGISYYVVKGNNDFYSNESYNKIIDIADHKILLTHGHKENVDFSLAGLIDKADVSSCDIVIFGHIHRYVEIERSGILLLNPGSPSLPRDGVASAMVMNIDNGIKIEKVVLD
ncbi:YfcE family phosphodiesterase [uncultured Anaerococcus sp.]|uniref:YfcE family phosphodiesterase n=1 Tax=uncultured Anaerococcus sp. TaxID=293428 RepID=UPI00288A8CA3|nr:YfcE family phosphodiesterase [uncultured Anaerococcus sp.]